MLPVRHSLKKALDRELETESEYESSPLLSRGSECLSDHPRWMFKKNSIEFFVGLQSYLYYCYSGCTLKSHDHLLFSRMFYGHLTLSRDFGLLSPYPAFYSVVYLGV